MQQVAVVIPIYKSSLTDHERVSLAQCHKQLGSYPVIIVKPESLVPDEEILQYPYAEIISLDDAYFQSISAYNRLMMSAEFYSTFSGYEYILIHQLDAFVFKDELAAWCNKGYHYIGAPWIRIRDKMNRINIIRSRLRHWAYKHINKSKIGVKDLDQMENQVGNGGFSLRHVAKFTSVCKELSPIIEIYLSRQGHQFNEDNFWSVEPNRKGKKMRIPDWRTALKFAFEIAPERARNLNHGNLPFGCHAWDINIDYWRPIFEEYGYVV